MLQSFRALLDIAILIGVSIGSLLSFAGLLGAFVPAFDLLNHFQLLFFWIACVAYFATFFWPFYYPSFKRFGRLVLIIPLVSSSFLLGPEVFKKVTTRGVADATVKAQQLQPVRLMSFNIYLGTWDAGALTNTILKHHPAIVSLQEYAPKRFKRLPDLKKAYPYQAHCQTWRRCTLAILSEHPLMNIKRYQLGPEGGSNPMHGKMLAATVQIKGSLPIRLYNVHLGWPMPIATKRAQLAQLAQIVRTEAAEFPNQVVTGDFNSSGWAFAIDQTSDLAGLERRSYFLTTFPSPHSRIKGMLLPAFLSLDHMLFSPTLKTDPVVRASATFGDHYPIITNLFLPPQ